MYRGPGASYLPVSSYYKPQNNLSKSSSSNFQHSSIENYRSEFKESIKTGKNFTNPDVWGRPMWFTLHNGANYYPEKASQSVAEKMKGFIHGIPYIVPCQKCSIHAREFVNKHEKYMDVICEGKRNLFNFFVDFHNAVNKRHGKKCMSYKEASDLYNSKNGAYPILYG